MCFSRLPRFSSASAAKGEVYNVVLCIIAEDCCCAGLDEAPLGVTRTTARTARTIVASFRAPVDCFLHICFLERAILRGDVKVIVVDVVVVVVVEEKEGEVILCELAIF